MPSTVHPFADLSSLAQALCPELIAALQEAKDEGTIERPLPIVVPSRHFADWLQTQIARRTGLCMGFEFIQPKDFIGRVIQAEASAAGINAGIGPWSPELLVWRILDRLPSFASRLGLSDASPSRDRFAAAAVLADQFDQYAHFRPDLIRAWAQARPVPVSSPSCPSGLKEAEVWQRDLWRQLKADIDASGTMQIHPALYLSQLKDAGRVKAAATLFPRLFVIGIGALDPLLTEMLCLLKETGSVLRTYAVLPSLHYLDDLRKKRELYEALKSDPDAEPPADGNPLLVAMGRQAIGAFLLLERLDPDFSGWEPLPDTAAPAAAASLLSQIQADVRDLVNPAARSPVPSFDPSDISLRLHACHGPRREIEVLRDELLRAFRELSDLKPDQVLIVAPDLERYAPFVDSVLRGESPPLPVRMTELPSSEQNSLTEALLSLLDFAHGRWPASGLVELLQLRAIRRRLGILDDERSLDQLKAWIRDSGLTEEGQGELAGGAWQAARERLIAGFWFDPAGAPTYPGLKEDDLGRFILPVAGALDGGSPLHASFTTWLSQLEGTLQLWRSKALPTIWSQRLGDACDALFACDESDDETPELNALINRLASLDWCRTEVDSGTLLDWMRVECEEHSAARSTLTGEIGFGRFRQLQNQPCRVLAMLGMQAGEFPRQGRAPAWDLLQLKTERWDRNPRVEDRQLFLDALLSPAERLIITGSVQNVRSGELEPFSSCVDELLRCASATSRLAPLADHPRSLAEALTVLHRLHPFSSLYFRAPSAAPVQEPSLPRSFHTRYAALATTLLSDAASPRPMLPFLDREWTATPEEREPEIELSLDDLIAFWRDPAVAWLKLQGVRTAFEEEDEKEMDRPPLQLAALDDWKLSQEILDTLVRNPGSLPAAHARLQARRGLPPGKLGDAAWLSRQEALKPVGDCVADLLRSAGELAPLAIDSRIDVDGRRIHVTGSIPLGCHHGDPVLLSYRAGNYKGEPKHLLGPWLMAVSAAACLPNATRSCLVSNESAKAGGPKIIPPCDSKEARDTLSRLITGFLHGRAKPLRYAPDTSEKIVTAFFGRNLPLPSDPELTSPPNPERLDKVLSKASEAWYSAYADSLGEGMKEGTRLVWRDRDPFLENEQARLEWYAWAVQIALPLLTWFKTEGRGD